jgi:phospho-N-acetylmuramoyl-pentapeptide-transferase
MFLWLSEHFRASFGPLNVFRYVTFRSMGAMATALVIAIWLFPWFIRLLQQKQIGQVVRDDGPQSHFSKKGTPTMGGVLLLLSMFLSVLLWADLSNLFVWMTLVVTLVFGVLGFIDDFLKIRDRNSKGVSEKHKLVTQFGTLGILFGCLYFGWFGQGLADTNLYLPFVSAKHFAVNIGPVAYCLFACVTVAGYSNAVNLTDGLDGLAIGPVMVSSLTFGILCYLVGAKFGNFDVAKYLLLPNVPAAHELAVLLAAIIGAGIGFLWYNTYPALVFMGDVGALALGGALGMVAVFSKNELLSLLINGLFVVEAASVAVQRFYFKRTGKRILRMAPIHHHFEKLGWPEPRVTIRFWIISVMLSLAAMASLKLR